jgi:hypothetical protein
MFIATGQEPIATGSLSTKALFSEFYDTYLERKHAVGRSAARSDGELRIPSWAPGAEACWSLLKTRRRGPEGRADLHAVRAMEPAVAAGMAAAPDQVEAVRLGYPPGAPWALT